MNITDFFQSNKFKILLIIIAGVVVLLGGFSIGEHIGFRKASFSFQNGNSFYQTYGPGNQGMTQPKDFSDTHGTVGKVISVTLPTITIEDRDNTEKVVLVSNQTVIRHFQDTLQPSDIKAGDYIVAIGDPNPQSQIAAVLIRELPAPTISPQQ